MQKTTKTVDIGAQYPYCHYVTPKMHATKNEQIKKTDYKAP